MDDLTITRLCAEAMGLDERTLTILESGLNGRKYDPLHNDDEAMALVKKFRLRIGQSMVVGKDSPEQEWYVERTNHEYATNTDLNRAICLAVAHIRSANGT